MDQAFCKSTNGALGRSITYKKGTSITRINIYSSEDKILSFPQKKWSNVVNLIPRCWLVTAGNGAIPGAELLADLALSSSCSQVSRGEQKSMLSSPCMTSSLP